MEREIDTPKFWESLNGKIIIVIGPSGAGKSTLVHRLLTKYPNIVESISYTTRNPRVGEVNGSHYFFIAVNEFEKMIKENYFLEYAKVHTNYYGTSANFLVKQLNNQKNVLLDVDVQGADNLRKCFGKKAICIFIAPPSLDDLKSRLIARNTDSMETINLRVNRAYEEMKRSKDYDYLIINQVLDTAYLEFCAIIERILH